MLTCHHSRYSPFDLLSLPLLTHSTTITALFHCFIYHLCSSPLTCVSSTDNAISTGIRCEQHGGNYFADKTPEEKRCKWHTLFEMAKIKNIRIAEFQEVKSGLGDDSTSNVAMIEFRFRYKNVPIAKAEHATAPDEQEEQMEEGEIGAEDADGKQILSDVENGSNVKMTLSFDKEDRMDEEGESGTGEAEASPTATAAATPKSANGGDDAMVLTEDEGPLESFESKDPTDFPLAKAFSDMPESGFEVRLRFRKPRLTVVKNQWYWPAACALLAGYDFYEVTTKRPQMEVQLKWPLDQWIQSKGTSWRYLDQ